MRIALALVLILAAPLAEAKNIASCAGPAGPACALLGDPPVPSEVEVPDVRVPGIGGLPEVEVPPVGSEIPPLGSEVPPPGLHACDLAPRRAPNAAPLVEARLEALGLAPVGEALGRSLREVADPPRFCRQTIG